MILLLLLETFKYVRICFSQSLFTFKMLLSVFPLQQKNYFTFKLRTQGMSKNIHFHHFEIVSINGLLDVWMLLPPDTSGNF